MTEEWKITGDYVEACNCEVACQCIWMEPPDGDTCSVSFVWNIEEGHYGDVDLNGVSVSMLARSEEGVMFDPSVPWHVVLIVDEAASDDQQAAVEDIYLGRAGGLWAAIADAHFETTEVEMAPISFSRNGSTISAGAGEIVSTEANVAGGFNEERATITPHPLGTDFEVDMGRSTTATVSYDDEFTWDVGGNNSYSGDFDLANA
jgi:hypothetical protein